jgi:hypothetical protein
LIGSDDLKDTEQATGIKYDPESPLFDPEIMKMIQFPDCMYADSAHCLWSSGGVGQYHVNQLIRAITRNTQITVADLDRFAKRVRLASNDRIGNTHFSDRFVDRDHAHYRGFASETLLAVEVLALFIQISFDVCSTAYDTLKHHIACFGHLVTLSQCFARGKPEDLPIAYSACKSHAKLFMELYPFCGKPKLHYIWESLNAWKRFKVFISTLGAEEEHQLPKRRMHTSYRNAMSTATHAWLVWFFDMLEDPASFADTYITGNDASSRRTKGIENKVPYLSLGALGICKVELSGVVCHTLCGTLRSRNLIYWQHANTIMYGVAQLFLLVRTSSQEFKYVAVVDLCQVLSCKCASIGELGFVDAQVVLGKMSYLSDGDKVHACLSV